MNWYIKNNPNYKKNDDCVYLTNLIDQFDDNEKPFIYIEGYIIPRIAYFDEYKELSKEDLVIKLFNKYGLDFIKYIKGIFIIVILFKDRFYILNDRHSVKKCFVFSKNNDFFISNSLELLSENFNLKIDYENAAIFSLISHFIDGATLFKNVSSSRPAELLKLEDCKVEMSSYWSPVEMLKSRKINNISLDIYAEKWKEIITNYVSYLKPRGISITTTGGNDSRMVLAALLSEKIRLHSFTFGDPKSYDGIITKQIKETINIEHDNYFVKHPTSEWFEKQAEKLVRFGNSLINIHRAHRNDAIEKEHNNYPLSEMIFTGLVGGEYLKKPNYNNIQIPVLISQILNTKKEKEAIELIDNCLILKGLNIENVNTKRIYKKIKRFIDYGDGLNSKERKFVYVYLFYGSAHHTQDSNVFANSVTYVVNSYMDIDFLELISGYKKWYINKKFNFFDQMFNSGFLVGITDKLAPELSTIPYAKKGKYTANELLRNKLKYLVLRFSYFCNKDKETYPANFPMGKWLYYFSKEKINNLNDEIASLYDSTFLLEQLEKVKTKSREESWHIITNPVNLDMIYEFYKKK